MFFSIRRAVLLVFFAAVSSAATAKAAPDIVIQSGHREAVYQVAVSPDETRLATIGGGEVKVWNLAGEVLWSAPARGDARAVAWSPDGKNIAVGIGGTRGFFVGKSGHSAGAQIRDAQSGALLKTWLKGNNTVDSLAFLPDGRLHAMSQEGSVLWNPDGSLFWNQESALHDKSAFSGTLLPSPNGKRLAVVTSGGVQIWDGAAKRKLASLWLKNIAPGRAAWSPEGKHLATFDGFTLRVWDVAQSFGGTPTTPREVVVSTVKEQLVRDPKLRDSQFLQRVPSVAWQDDGQTIAVATTWWPDVRDDPTYGEIEGTPRVFLRLVSWPGAAVSTIAAPAPGAIYDLDCLPGARLAQGGSTPSAGQEPVGMLAVSSFALKNNLESDLKNWLAAGFSESANDLALSPNGSLLAVAGDDTSVRLWDWKRGVLKATLKRVSGPVVVLAWSADNRKIAALDVDNLVVWDVATAKALHVWKGLDVYEFEGNSVAWSPDGKFIVAGTSGGIKMWNAQTGAAREPYPGGFPPGYGPLQWDEDGLWAGALAYENTLARLDPQKLVAQKHLSASGLGSEERLDGPVSDFDFFDDGKRLVTVGGDTDLGKLQVQIWDVEKDIVERTLRDLPPSVVLVEISPDEKRVAVADGAGGVALVNLTTLKTIWRYDSGSLVHDLVWSGDGETLFVAGQNGRISLLSAAGALRASFLKLPQRPVLSPGKTIMDGAGSEWLAWIPNGFYNGSKNAEQHFRWRDGQALQPGASFPKQRVAGLKLF